MQNICIALIGLLLSGCSSFNYDKPDSPTPLISITSFEPKPKIALVLGDLPPFATPLISRKFGLRLI